MTYLITGGAGFIGSHLADRLIDDGHRVRVLDDLSTGRRANIAPLKARDAFTFTTGSVLDEELLDREIGACDRVVHLAAAVGVKRILDRPVETIHTNVDGTKNVLRRAVQEQKKVLLASTSEVYGKAMQENEDLEALSETDNWTLGTTSKRRWAYACTKAMDEFLAQAYHDEHGLPVVCARFFNTAGPRQSGQYGMVIPTFVERALSGQPLEIHGDGTQTRCFTHIDDAVESVVQLLQSPAAEGEVVNIGQPTEISINELAERILEMTGSGADVRHVPYEEVYGDGFEDMKRRTPDCSKLTDLTGYEPERTVDDILRDVIAEARAEKDEQAEAAA